MRSALPLTLDERIGAMAALGRYLQERDERLAAHMHRAGAQNPWFTDADMRHAIDAIATHFLDERKLRAWTRDVPSETADSAIVGIIMAGNIPLVGFHDLLCTFIAGHRAQIRLSDKDKTLLPFLIRKLSEIEPHTSGYFDIVEKLKNFDAVIATGSNNTARYFQYYFGKYPHIIRKNRNAVAVLTGDETTEQLRRLGEDVFRYFGLGCRSVAHLYVPEGYDFTAIKQAFTDYEDIAQHQKYSNNLDYNLAIYILNKEPHIALPHLILLQNDDLISPVGCLYYSHYQDLQSLESKLLGLREDIQVVVTETQMRDLPMAGFGAAQQPALADYADGVDTLDFLLNLKTA